MGRIYHYSLSDAFTWYKGKEMDLLLFSSVGFFFSCITPSASGGQPAQVYYMKKEDIPIPISTMVLLIITIIYKMVLVLLGVALVILGRDLYIGIYRMQSSGFISEWD